MFRTLHGAVATDAGRTPAQWAGLIGSGALDVATIVLVSPFILVFGVVGAVRLLAD